jgi:hypothetical protein
MQTAGFCIFIEVYNSRWRMFLLTDFLLLELSFLSTHVANQVPVVIFSSSSFVRSFLRTFISVLVYTFVFAASHSLC